MKALIINLETTLPIHGNYYIMHISYILYDFNNYKILITQTCDIDLYHRAHNVFYDNSTNNEKYVIKNNKITKIITIINYYIRMSDIIIGYDYNFIKKVLVQEAQRNNIQCELELNKIDTYCILQINNKIFYKNDPFNNTSSKQNELLYIIYLKLFSLSYLYSITHTLLNCLLIIRIYYKFISGKDLEKYDYHIKRLRIYNS